MSGLLISLPILRNSSNLDSDSSAINNIHVLPERLVSLHQYGGNIKNVISYLTFALGGVRDLPQPPPLCCSNIF